MSETYKDTNYILIQGWMTNRLKLKGNELLCYAIIYGFTQKDGETYHGGVDYLAQACNTSGRTIIRTLDKLSGDGLIKKDSMVVKGVRNANYTCNTDKIPKIDEESECDKSSHSDKMSPTTDTTKCHIEDDKMSHQDMTKCHIDGDKMSHNNKYKEDINKNKKEERKKEATKSSYKIIIDEFTDNDVMKDTIYEFIKMRKLIKAPMTDKALKDMLSKLKRIGRTEAEQLEILNNSIMNSWKGVFPLKKRNEPIWSQTVTPEDEALQKELDKII